MFTVLAEEMIAGPWSGGSALLNIRYFPAHSHHITLTHPANQLKLIFLVKADVAIVLRIAQQLGRPIWFFLCLFLHAK